MTFNVRKAGLQCLFYTGAQNSFWRKPLKGPDISTNLKKG
jgi:hypothetical protein